MGLISASFLKFALGGVFLYHLAPAGKWQGTWRRGVLGLLSVIFLSTHAAGDVMQDWHAWLSLAPLVGFAVLGYAALSIVKGDSSWRLSAVVVLLVCIFAYFKRYILFEYIPFPTTAIVVIGISYILFRILQITIDYAQGALEEKPSPTGYLYHLFSFYTLLSGPIWRYQDHQAGLTQLNEYRLTNDDAYAGFSRIANGVLKMIFISPLFETAYVANSKILLENGPLTFGRFSFIYLRAIVEFLLYLYMNFSGYMDLMIGLCRLFGLRLPENFNDPFISSNFLDLWNRWHITLSEFFKFYVFNPILSSLTRQFGGKGRAPYLGSVAYFVTFFILGLWHGTTWPFVFYGVLLALGASLNKLWETLLLRQLGKANAAKLRGMLWYQILARSVALMYFTMTLTLWLPIDLTVFRAFVSYKKVGGSFVVGIMLACVVQIIWFLLCAICRPIARRLGAVGSHPVVLQLGLGLRTLFIIWALFSFNGVAPKLVYQGF